MSEKRRTPPDGRVLLICHTCERRRGFGKARRVYEADQPTDGFMREHAECIRRAIPPASPSSPE